MTGVQTCALPIYRHAGLESGTIKPAQIVDVIRGAGAPAVCETPDPAVDIAWLRRQLG